MSLLAKIFANYRLNMAGITQNKQKCLVIASLKVGKILSRFDQKEGNSTLKINE